MPEPVTKKARQTREHILENALTLFASQGYYKTTLRDIAAGAGVSLGLTYRYFARKEDLVAALYERLTAETEQSVAGLPALTLTKRFASALRDCLSRLEPHRESLGALLPAAWIRHPRCRCWARKPRTSAKEPGGRISRWSAEPPMRPAKPRLPS